MSAGPFLRPSQGQVQGNVPATEDIRPRQIEGTLTLPRCIEKAPPSPLGLEVISFEQPDQTARIGETHRLRLIHIAPAADIRITMLKDSTPVQIKFIAKDGTDLPPLQQRFLTISPDFGVGETGDFEFKPLTAGIYHLQFIYAGGFFTWSQKWIVTD